MSPDWKSALACGAALHAERGEEGGGNVGRDQSAHIHPPEARCASLEAT